MNPALLIFTQIAIAGCGFLVYFLVVLWRDSRRSRKHPKVEVRVMASSPSSAKVIQLYSSDKIGTQEVGRAHGR